MGLRPTGAPSVTDDGPALRAGMVVGGVTVAALLGPFVGLGAAPVALGTAAALGALSLDAARFGGLGGHLLAEALPGGRARLRRIALHEAAHALVASENGLTVKQVLVGSLACLRAGLRCNGSTAFELPAAVKLQAEDLRRWSRMLQAGMVAEELHFGRALGGADDRVLLGRLWGLSGHDVDTAQREQRRARREVEQWLRRETGRLEAEAERLLARAPTLLRPMTPAR
ncbi:hypothetical protein [Cyanobium sp. Morenito 9A2]|uniref:hypothetical protein n=1 Tax=Cyanobium sp. Morenito 9A2 TaxID=2823718 RepID=UPI0020CC2D33|nr:hypothetical protein [Cyanobium sp. Morenito 9A2]MCP9848425.1 hypothetical protein [Cyanobium sp. Morenito 9A2]